MNTTTRADDQQILDFVDPSRNLNGRIGVFKINFNKNLRRFQDIAAEQAQKEPRIAEIVNRFVKETLLPSVWGFSSQLGQSSKFLKHIQQKTDSVNSPERTNATVADNIGQDAILPSSIYSLNSATLPLQINFNPLMITYCLFLRALADMTKASSPQHQSVMVTGSRGDKIAEFCLVHRKKIVSKLY